MVPTRAISYVENQGNELKGPLSTHSSAEASCRRVPSILNCDLVIYLRVTCYCGETSSQGPRFFNLFCKMPQSAQLGALPRIAAPEKATGPFQSGTRNPRLG